MVTGLGILAIDTAMYRMPWYSWSPCGLLLIGAFVPGSALCWWRFSRFNRNFRLQFESTRYRQMQGELSQARKIHEALLPAPFEHRTVGMNYAYEPMRDIGGDLLYVHPAGATDSRPVNIVLMDVTGHGVAAALSVNRIVGELDRLFGEQPDLPPAELVRLLNRYVELTMSRHSVFVTALALRFDPASRSLQFCSAGHPTAFVVRARGGVEKLGSTAMVLGATDDQTFFCDARTLTLAPGDTVVMYTDGASEAMDDHGRMLREEGVLRKLERVRSEPPRDWPRLMLDMVRTYRNAPPADDTLVVSLYGR